MAQSPVDILAECLNAIERSELTVEECLQRYPEQRQELAELLEAAAQLQILPVVEPRRAFRMGARARLLERVATSRHLSWRDRLSRAWQAFRRPSWAPPRLAWVPAAMLVLVFLMSGTAYAADGAIPGDPLYGLDMALEKAQLALRAQPEQAARLNLAFANERLVEAQSLAKAGDTAGLAVALDEYDALLTALASAVEAAPEGFSETLEELIRDSLAAHEADWAQVFTALEPGPPSEVPEPLQGPVPAPSADSCLRDKARPAAQVLAGSYADITYEQVLSWFCESGYEYSDIKLALKTRADNGEYSVEQLLALKQELGGWGKVWQEIGAIGKPDKPGEAPESANPPGHRGEPPGQIGKDKDNKKDKNGQPGQGGNSGGGGVGSPGNSGEAGEKDKDKAPGNQGGGRGG